LSSGEQVALEVEAAGGSLKHLAYVLTIAGGILLAAPAGAQQGRDDQVPQRYQPPPGMCRIWIDSVPPDRQPEPTDCPTAIRRRPKNARVLFGEEPRRTEERVRLPRSLRPPEKEPEEKRPVERERRERPPEAERERRERRPEKEKPPESRDSKRRLPSGIKIRP
jgi:hypothetical protein